MKIEKRFFGLLNGEIVYLYTLTNDNGFSAQVMPYGASLVAIYAPDNAWEQQLDALPIASKMENIPSMEKLSRLLQIRKIIVYMVVLKDLIRNYG